MSIIYWAMQTRLNIQLDEYVLNQDCYMLDRAKHASDVILILLYDVALINLLFMICLYCGM